MNTKITLYNGRVFDYANPTPLTIREIAHGLARTCRFAGQCIPFYSVAQHSVIVSSVVTQQNAVYGLLHDASEAVMGDMTTPLKNLIPQFREIEDRIQGTILRSFGLDLPMPEEVKIIDYVALAWEKHNHLPPDDGEHWEWLKKYTNSGSTKPMTALLPYEAEVVFLNRARALGLLE